MNHRKCCESMGFDCRQGRDCPARRESDGTEWWESPALFAIFIVATACIWGLVDLLPELLAK